MDTPTTKAINQVDNFVHLCGTVCEDGGNSRSGSMGDDGGYYVGQKVEDTAKKKAVWHQLVNPCTDREAGGEPTGRREKLGSDNV